MKLKNVSKFILLYLLNSIGLAGNLGLYLKSNDVVFIVGLAYHFVVIMIAAYWVTKVTEGYYELRR